MENFSFGEIVPFHFTILKRKNRYPVLARVPSG